MILFLQSLFISFVILHRGNIWVALIPNPSNVIINIGVYLFLLSMLVRRSDIVKCSYGIFMLIFFSMLVVIVTLPYYPVFFKINTIGGYLLVTSLSVLIVSLWEIRQEIVVARVYIIICTIISVLGILAWLIVQFEFMIHHNIDPEHVIHITEFTAGRWSMGEPVGAAPNILGFHRSIFSFPYSLGLILVGSVVQDFFGVPFFRASAIFHEPFGNIFLITPMIILTCNSIYFGKWPRRILLAIQLCYMIVSFSVSIIISLISVYVLYNILLFIKDSSWRNSSGFLRFIFILSIIGLITYLGIKVSPATVLTKNIITTKFASGNYKYNFLETISNPYTFFAYYFFSITSLWCSWKAVKLNNKMLLSYSLIMVSFIVVSLKGAFLHVLICPAFLIFFFLMIKKLSGSVDLSGIYQYYHSPQTNNLRP